MSDSDAGRKLEKPEGVAEEDDKCGDTVVKLLVREREKEGGRESVRERQSLERKKHN